MPKGRSNQDKYPQLMIAELTTANNTHWKSTALEVPLLNLPSTTLAKTIEVLKIQVIHLGGTHDDVLIAIGSADLDGVILTAYPIVNTATDQRFFALTTTGTEEVVTVDLTDDAGRGVLYPAQTLFINAHSRVAGRALAIRMMYRMKNVGLNEYIGIMNQYIVQH